VIESDQPVQVISGNECTNVPYDVLACDHLEETLPPAQALGRRYFVAAPTGPNGDPISYAVQLTGNQNDTLLYYLGTKPLHAPGGLQAGKSALLLNVSGNFEVFGDHEFGVLLFLQGGESDPALSENTDPSQSVAMRGAVSSALRVPSPR
jgi:IgGFc binding protein